MRSRLNSTSLDLVARCAQLPGTVALLSGGDPDSARYHVLGLWPWLSLRGRGGAMQLKKDDLAVGGQNGDSFILSLMWKARCEALT